MNPSMKRILGLVAAVFAFSFASAALADPGDPKECMQDPTCGPTPTTSGCSLARPLATDAESGASALALAVGAMLVARRRSASR